MNELFSPLRHVDFGTKSDDKLRDEARTHLARSPQLQVVAEILGKLRALSLPWWSADRMRSAFPMSARMQWIAERPDLRQTITHRLTGLAMRAARARSVASQAELIDAVIDAGDVDGATAEGLFEPRDLVVYGPVASYWKKLHESMPWDSDARPHQQLMAWIIRAFLADRSEDGTPRKPILSAWDVRTAIDNKVWHHRIPIEVRAALDDARLQAEKRTPREPLLARQELEIATPEIIAASVPLRELQRVFAQAERNLGFAERVVNKTPQPHVIPLAKLQGEAEGPSSGPVVLDEALESAVIEASGLE